MWLNEHTRKKGEGHWIKTHEAPFLRDSSK